MRAFCKRSKAAAVFMLACILVFSGCAAPVPGDGDGTVRVTLVKSEYFEAERGLYSVEIPIGGDARFSVAVKSGFFVAGVDYENAAIESGADGLTRIFLPAVIYSVRVRLFFGQKQDPSGEAGGADPEDDPYNDTENPSAIRYYANGGTYFDSEYSYEAEIVLNGHLRPNTEIGTDRICRDGFTLLGWNTRPDGSGAFYGLGSRCDLPENGQLRLYAQWEKWSPASDFAFALREGGYCVTGYSGKDKSVCIPETVDGIPVTGIAAGAFSGGNFTSVTLPKRMERVEDGAFSESTVEQIRFFDNLLRISDATFGDGRLPAVHINAIEPPRYSKLDRHSNYTDKIDILRAWKDKKKIVIFGGSGAFFSVDSAMIREAFGGEYEVVNMAINAWFPATAQTDIILNYIREGDIFLHLPEMASPAQLFYENHFALPSETDPDGFDDRYMSAFENNYDALSLVDPNDAPGLIDSFSRFQAERQNKNPASYSDNPDFIDEYGDYKGEKPRSMYDYTVSGEAAIRSDYLTEAAIARLDLLYRRIREKGAQAFLGYAAVNVSALEASDREQGTHYLDVEAERFDGILRQAVKEAPIIEKIGQSFYTGSWFFNTDWHLSDEGTAKNTEVLIGCLKKFMTR